MDSSSATSSLYVLTGCSGTGWEDLIDYLIAEHAFMEHTNNPSTHTLEDVMRENDVAD